MGIIGLALRIQCDSKNCNVGYILPKKDYPTTREVIAHLRDPETALGEWDCTYSGGKWHLLCPHHRKRKPIKLGGKGPVYSLRRQGSGDRS